MLTQVEIPVGDDPQYEADEYFRVHEWSDGLPVRLPRVELVDRFIAASGLDPELDFGTLPPKHGRATLAAIAVNAYMAGCRPEHLPLLAAAIKAMSKPQFSLLPVQATTNPVAPLAVVNGPARHKLGISSGRNLLSPGAHFNGAVGRAIRLIMRNVGGAISDEDMATHGSPGKYTLCFAEAEEDSPWEPLSVALGYDRSENVVTMVPAEGVFNIHTTWGNTQAKHLIDVYTRAVRLPGSGLWWSSGTPLFLLCPGHAEILDREGINRERLQRILFDAARIPLAELPLGNIPIGSWTVVDDHVQLYARPQDILIAVGGGAEGHHTVCFVPFCFSAAASARIKDVSEFTHS